MSKFYEVDTYITNYDISTGTVYKKFRSVIVNPDTIMHIDPYGKEKGYVSLYLGNEYYIVKADDLSKMGIEVVKI